ncbi:hypothetical protein B7486_55465, partial [cyanobacterium TDX16]
MEPGGAIVLTMCMTGDTPVLMADGSEKPLEDVQPGDVIATYDGGRISTSKVKNWKNQGCDDIYEIRTSSGRIVRANERHPFLVETGESARWIRLRDLKVGDRIVAVTPSGGRCEGPLARPMDATSPPSARDFARLITARIAGREASGLLRLIPRRGEPYASSIGMVSRRPSTTLFLLPRTGSVPFAASRPARTCEPIGAASSASTTIIEPESYGASSVTTAISRSDTESRRKSYSGPLSTYGTIPDRIVAIVPAGHEAVYDIEVEGTENFIANGLVSHNTRWHEDDLAGRILASEDAPNWEVVKLPALAEEDDPLGREPGEPLCPDRYDADALASIRTVQGSYGFSALYQQSPLPPGGGMFRREFFAERYVDVAPASLKRVRYWDKAGTEGAGAYSCGVLMGRSAEGLYFILDIIRGQWSAGQRESIIRDTAQADGRSVPVWVEQEPGSGGKESAENTVRALAGWDAHAERVTGDKETRARPFAAQCEAGNVRLVKAPWNRDFIDEAIGFPSGRFKDQVDAA